MSLLHKSFTVLYDYKVIDHAHAFYCAAEFSLEKGFVVQPPLH